MEELALDDQKFVLMLENLSKTEYCYNGFVATYSFCFKDFEMTVETLKRRLTKENGPWNILDNGKIDIKQLQKRLSDQFPWHIVVRSFYNPNIVLIREIFW